MKLNFFGNLFKTDFNSRCLSIVKPGERVWIELDRIKKGGSGRVKCLNNDPYNKKILFSITWAEPDIPNDNFLRKEKLVLRYDSKELANFELFNPKLIVRKPPSMTVSELEIILEEALQKEDYTRAAEIRNTIAKMKS